MALHPKPPLDEGDVKWVRAHCLELLERVHAIYAHDKSPGHLVQQGPRKTKPKQPPTRNGRGKGGERERKSESARLGPERPPGRRTARH